MLVTSEMNSGVERAGDQSVRRPSIQSILAFARNERGVAHFLQQISDVVLILMKITSHFCVSEISRSTSASLRNFSTGTEARQKRYP